MTTAGRTLLKTLCNRDCPDTCGIVATVQDGRVTRISGDPDHPITRGFLCYRTNQFLATQYGSSRLTTPLLRKAGELVAVGWEEALDTAAQRLTAIRDQWGPAAIFHYRSGGSLGLLKILSDYFFELFGPVTIKRGDICSGAGEAAQTVDFGLSDSSDPATLLDARQILLWGKNVHTASPHTIPILKDAVRRGAELTLIDPVLHDGARLAQRHVQVAPGGDFALAMAVAQILFQRGWVDPHAVDYCDNLADFRALCSSESVGSWCQHADVTPEQAEDLARRLGVERPCAILIGWGLGRRSNGGATVRAIDALCAVSGNIGVSGGGASFYFQRRGGFDTAFVRGLDAAPRSISEPLFGTGILEQTGPPIKALWVTAGNPVAMLPDSEQNARAVASLDFSVVVDSHLTDTARLASLVLPTTTLLEDDDILGAYGHHTIGVSRPVVPPPDTVRTDLQIVQELAARVGLCQQLQGSAAEWKQRLIAPALVARGVTVELLERGPVPNPLAPRVVFDQRRFPTASGKVNLLSEAPVASAPADLNYPLTLMALSTRHSQSSQWALSAPTRLTATLHPDSAAGLADGDVCLLQSAIGQIEVLLRHDSAQRRGVVLLPKGGHHQRSASANSLLAARVTDIGEGGALYEQPVRLVPLQASHGVA